MSLTDYTRLHSTESEQSVIGGLLLQDSEAIDRIGALRPAHFFTEAHRVIFSTILAMSAENQPIDVITVAERLDAAGQSERAGGLVYLGQLAQNTPSSKSIRRYADIVVGKAMERSLVAAADEIRCAAMGVGTTREKLSQAQAAVMAITESVEPHSPQTIRDVLTRSVGLLQKRGEGGESGLATGFSDLDSRLTGGMRPGNLIIVAGRPAMGKAQPLTSLVLLENGKFVQMGDIKSGDMLASVDGACSEVVGIFPQGNRPIFQISLTDGRRVEADAEHLWSVGSSKWESSRVVTTLELIRLLGLVRYKNRITLYSHSGDFGDDGVMSIDPWLLGFLLGDGGLTGSAVRFSTAESYIVDRVRQASGCDVRHLGNYDYGISTLRGAANPVLDSLREHGVMGKLAKDKSIPDFVMSASKRIRQGVLTGLIESDGWVEKTGCVIFSSASELLRDQVVDLVRSLGGSATNNTKTNVRYKHKGESRSGLPSHQTCIKLSSLASFIQSPRILKNLKDRTYPDAPYVASVEYVRDDLAQCIKVSHPSSLYITDGWVVTHNTAFAVDVAMRVAMERHPALILSMEMGDTELADRLIANAGRVALSAVLAGDMEGDNGDRIMTAVSKLHDLPLIIDEQGGLTMFDVASKARSVKRKHGLSLLVVDYLQLMSGDGDNRNSQIEQITRGMKSLAKELQIPIVLLSQLSRKCEERTNRRPIPSDLRESGAIEQDADVILMVYRDEVYSPDSPDKGTAELIVAKNRQGAIGTVRLAYIGEQTRFEQLSHGWQPAEVERQTKKGRGF